MCGLSGGFTQKNFRSQSSAEVRRDLECLFSQSQARGQDAAGIILTKNKQIFSCLQKKTATQLLNSAEHRNSVAAALGEIQPGAIVLAHSRLATNALHSGESFIQPLSMRSFFGGHNGIITELNGYPLSEKSFDTEILLKEIQTQYDRTGQPVESVQAVYEKLHGAASIALVWPEQGSLILATNTGSLYYCVDESQGIFYFASEKIFLQRMISESSLLRQSIEIKQLKAQELLLVTAEQMKTFSLPAPSEKEKYSQHAASEIKEKSKEQIKFQLPSFKRCSCCILPETYPLIEFDEKGVCNFCRRYSRQRTFGKEALLRFLEPYRSRNSQADCLVGLSGGRDSCYGLHLLKNELGMNPIAYTFDWGLTTDISRRNQARLCAQLGVEHIIRSADLEKKRSYIQKNVEAFLKHPHPGMVPLFMAGDKEFYEYGRVLRKENNLPLTVFCAGHSLEQRDFMTGFCGVDENIANNKRLFQFSAYNKIKLALFYASQYARNPAYINASLLDSFKSFIYSFIYRDDFLYLYEYWLWNESEIEKTLSQTYSWQADHGYGANQWRMGDGQTAFTNYIYFAMAGFTEFDNFRSNQIREGMLTRDVALRLVAEDNQPKMELLRYFAEVVGLDLEKTLSLIGARSYFLPRSI